jgi:glutamate 5-kinase
MLLKRHYTKSTLEINELCKKNDIDCLFSENPEDHEDETKIDHGIERKDKKLFDYPSDPGTEYFFY